ncbi:zinc knuckle CX2CX4HX4C containing protein [Tanacetum coccineum]
MSPLSFHLCVVITKTKSATPKSPLSSKDSKPTTTTKIETLLASFSWLPDEATLLVMWYVAVSEDNKVGSDQTNDSFYVAATFGVPLTTIGDLYMFIKCIEDGKHDELLSGMTNDDRMETLDALGAICNSIKADNTKVDVIPCKAVDIDTMSTSYARAAGESAKDQPKVNSNFRPLVADTVFDGILTSISSKNWAKHGLKRIMMNSKGFFFFKFDSRAGLEAVLEGGPWLIRKSPIFLKKWLMDTRLLKEESTMTHLISIPSLTEDGFTKETIRVVFLPNCYYFYSNVVTLTVEKTNDGFQTVSKKKKRKGKSKSTNGGQFASLLVKQNARHEPKVTTGAPKKEATNMGNPSTSSSMLKTTGTSSKKDKIPMSNSYSVLNDEKKGIRSVNVYDETAKLSTKTVESSPFTAVVG